jgi:hypothetical protein
MESAVDPAEDVVWRRIDDNLFTVQFGCLGEGNGSSQCFVQTVVYSVVGIKNVVTASMTSQNFEWGDFTLAAVVEAVDREDVA